MYQFLPTKFTWQEAGTVSHAHAHTPITTSIPSLTDIKRRRSAYLNNIQLSILENSWCSRASVCCHSSELVSHIIQTSYFTTMNSLPYLPIYSMHRHNDTMCFPILMIPALESKDEKLEISIIILRGRCNHSWHKLSSHNIHFHR
jgi:hypothetical protein